MKYAFSLLELVFVIVILSILASLSLPTITYHETNIKQKAIDNLLADLYYTKYLALIDHKHHFETPAWKRGLWTFQTHTCDDALFYLITSNDEVYGGSHVGSFDMKDAAIDPVNNKRMFMSNDCIYNQNDISPRINLTKRYGISQVNFSGGCASGAVSFDTLGRVYNTTPFATTLPNLTHTKCNLVFTLKSSETFTLTIEPETGYISTN